MVVDFSIAPVGAGESLSSYVAEVFWIIHESGLPYEHHAMGTNIEGDWNEVMALIKVCRDRILERADRVSILIKIDDRKGVTDGLSRKVASAKAKML
jgi:uncharacterized protein (TIGR00106 family)